MSQNLSLGDFIKQLTARLQGEGIPIPFKNERPWHFLFYELKKERDLPGWPRFLDQLLFDWDGPYPRSRELSAFLHALHWNASVSANNPHYETIELPDSVADLWQQRIGGLDKDARQFLDETVRRARAEFAQAADRAVAADAEPTRAG